MHIANDLVLVAALGIDADGRKHPFAQEHDGDKGWRNAAMALRGAAAGMLEATRACVD